MNCHSHNRSGSCCCGNGGMDPALWSKKKKIRILEHKLECLEEKKKDIEEVLQELKAE